MNPEYVRQLEARVRRELDALGELAAPPALANRILRAVEQRAAAPWYRQSWAAWPLALRVISLTVLLLAFGGVCLGSWELAQGAAGQNWLGDGFAAAGALWQTMVVLITTAGRLISQLGQGFLVIAAALMFGTCVVCIGLGTAWVRLAMRPATNGN